MSMMADRKQEAETRYIGGTMSLKALAQEMEINPKTMQRWCAEGDWVKKRRRMMAKAAQRAEKKAVTRKSKELARLMATQTVMEDVLDRAARALLMAMDGLPEELADGKTRAKNILSIQEAIERAVTAKMLMAGMLTRADAEKIEIMRRQQTLAEKKADMEEGAGGAQIVVRLAPEIEKLVDDEGDYTDDAGAESAADASAQKP